jgi:hypothetical protein
MHKIELDCQTSSRTASWISHANVQGTCNFRRFLAHAFHDTAQFSGSSFAESSLQRGFEAKFHEGKTT